MVHEGAERTGATVLAEGVEDAGLLRHASAVGAELGQGYYLGEPAPLLPAREADCVVGGVGAEPIQDIRTPFEAISERRKSRATADVLLPLSRQVAFGETHLGEPAMVVNLVPDPGLFGPAEQVELTRLGESWRDYRCSRPRRQRDPLPGVRRTDVQDKWTGNGFYLH